jgi:hypothetical protein
MVDHPNVELLRKGYAAFSSGDIDTLSSLLAGRARSPASSTTCAEPRGRSKVDALR